MGEIRRKGGRRGEEVVGGEERGREIYFDAFKQSVGEGFYDINSLSLILIFKTRQII